MKLKVISKYKNDLILLEGIPQKSFDNKILYLKKQKAAKIIDTIGRVEHPIYVAKILDHNICDKAKELEE